MKVNKSFIFSYLTMRKTIGILGLSLPFLLVGGGLLQSGLPVIGSISGYYHSPMRDLYVGLLSVISLFLISYRGYQVIDDVTGNLSGFFALGLMLFPTWPYYMESRRVGLFLLDGRVSDYLHHGFAALFFLSLAFTSIFLFTRSDKHKLAISRAKRRRNVVYVVCGLLMTLSIVGVIFYLVFLQASPLSRYKPVLLLESVGLCAFGVAWLLKGHSFLRDRRIRY